MNGRGSKLDGPGRLRIIECRKNCDKLQNDALKRDDRVRRRVRPEIKAMATLLGHNRRTMMLWWTQPSRNLASNGRGHYVRGGQAPYSHEKSHEDGSMFGTFQDDLRNECVTWTVLPHTHVLRSCMRKSPNSGAPQSIAAWL